MVDGRERRAGSVMSSFAVSSAGCSAASQAACSEVSVVAITVCPRSASSTAASFPNPVRRR